MYLKLALRNLARNVRRTAITVAAIVFGLAMMHVTIAMGTGQYREMIRVGVSQLAGHVVIQDRGYQKKHDSDLVVSGVAAAVERVRAEVPGATVAPRMSLAGLLVSPTASVGVGLLGVDGPTEAQVQDIEGKVVEGEWLATDLRSIVIGDQLARTLGVSLGDKVVYMGQHGGATEVGSHLFRVSGVFHSGAAELDGFGAFVTLAAAQAAFGQPDTANLVTVHLADPNDIEHAAAALGRAFADRPELEVLTWREALPDMWSLIQIDRVSNDVMMGILGLIVAMGVLNTLLMSVLERVREFGVMLALGLEPRRLAVMIVAEGLMIGVIGSALGLAVGFALSWPLVTHGIDYTEVMGETVESGGVAVSAVLKGAYNPLRSGVYTVGAVVFTVLASLYPAWFVARLQPVDAMHHT
ncbi:MAG: FtsX-like permease family protein [Myxococcota bacterium]